MRNERSSNIGRDFFGPSSGSYLKLYRNGSVDGVLLTINIGSVPAKYPENPSVLQCKIGWFVRPSRALLGLGKGHLINIYNARSVPHLHCRFDDSILHIC